MTSTSTSYRCILFTFGYMLISSIQQVESANILFFFGVSSYSHRIPAWPLVTALAEKGHNVTFISPYPPKNPHPKVTDYAPRILVEYAASWEDMEDVFNERKKADGDLITQWITLLPAFGIEVCKVVYSDDEFINWVKTSKFDLVFIDTLFNDCGYGMAHMFGAKIIQFATTTLFPWYSSSFGNPDETSWLAEMMSPFDPTTVTFRQRLTNALIPVAWELYRKWFYFPKLQEITQNAMGIKVSQFEEIERNVSLVMVNTYYAEEFARSLPPNMELAAFLEKGNGFIYMSFGTVADFQRMDTERQQAFLGAMQSFPAIQFVWKVGKKFSGNQFPKGNVYISDWMPQQDILAHPKIRAFITHSGLLGIQEAIQNQVPLISFPIAAEQDYNAERIHRRETGIRIEINNVTQAALEDAITKVLTYPKYKDNMKKVSRIFTDRPQKPLYAALWWTEFVLKHSREDLEALRPLSVGQPWWIRRNLDVWMSLLLTLTISVITTLLMLLKIFKYLCCKSTTVKSDENPATRKKKAQ